MKLRKKLAKWRKQTLSDKIFDIINYTVLTLIGLVCLYPLYYIVIVSFSESAFGAYLLPNNFTLSGYRMVFGDSEIWRAYLNTIFYTAGSVLFGLFLTIPCAYALSRDDLPGRGLFMAYLTVTMFVSGGLIPTYLTVQQLHLVNKWPTVILMTGVSAYNVIVARTFFQTTISRDLLEAARLDGCGNGNFLLKIVMPLSKPIIAVLGLWIGVGRWNSYFTELVYLRDEKWYPLAMYLKKVLWQVDALRQAIMNSASNGELGEVTTNMLEQMQLASVMQYVVIVVSTAPMLVIYPKIQKYFAQGVMLGSVKG